MRWTTEWRGPVGRHTAVSCRTLCVEHDYILQDLMFSQQSHWGLVSSGMWQCVTVWVDLDVSKDHSSSIFKSQAVKECQEPLTQEHSIKFQKSEILSIRFYWCLQYWTVTFLLWDLNFMLATLVSCCVRAACILSSLITSVAVANPDPEVWHSRVPHNTELYHSTTPDLHTHMHAHTLSLSECILHVFADV
jgi:hypothetical protein